MAQPELTMHAATSALLSSRQHSDTYRSRSMSRKRRCIFWTPASACRALDASQQCIACFARRPPTLVLPDAGRSLFRRVDTPELNPQVAYFESVAIDDHREAADQVALAYSMCRRGCRKGNDKNEA